MSRKTISKGPNVAVEISGGFGNQLFQLAAAEFLRNHGLRVFLDFSVNQKNGARDNLISEIASRLSFPIQSLTPWQTVFWKMPLLKRICGLRKSARIMKEEVEFLAPLVVFTNQRIIYRGYWQNANVAATVRERIAQYFRLSECGSVDRIALHVRRGDYLLGGNPSFHGVLTGEYYVAAVQAIRDVLGNLPVIVFTDSPKMVSEEAWVSEISHLDFAPSLGVIEDFTEIAISRAIICSNSTYSWWASYISNSDHIILPSKWQVNLELPEGLLQEKAKVVRALFVGQD